MGQWLPRVLLHIPSAEAQSFTARFDKNLFKESAYSAGKLAPVVIPGGISLTAGQLVTQAASGNAQSAAPSDRVHSPQ